MKRSLLCGVGVLLCASATVHADIGVYQYDGSGNLLVAVVNIASGDPISLSVYSSDVQAIVVRSTGNPATDDIGRITVADDAWGNDIRIYVAQSKSISDESMYTSAGDRACQDWAGIEDHRDSGKLALKAYIGGDLTGSIQGATSSDPYTTLNTLQVEGTVGAKVYAHDGYYLLECNKAVKTNGTAIWSDTDIGLVRATVSSNVDGIDCNVIAGKAGGGSNHYTIDWIDAPNSLVGSDYASLITIGTDGTSNVKIRAITTYNRVFANINAPDGIALLRATSTNGSSLGDITASTLLDRSSGVGGLIDVPACCWSTITLDELPTQAVICVGELVAFETEEVPTPGIILTGETPLHGQIIILDDPFLQVDTWTRPVLVDEFVINKAGYPYHGAYPYSESSADLGGGAVGLVAYPLYRGDCEPKFDPITPEQMLVTELIPTDGVTSKSITLRFYGPVRTDAEENDEDQPIIFGKLLVEDFVDQTDKVTITVKRGEDSGWSREVKIEGKEGQDLMPGLYHIYVRTEGSARLYCDQTGLSEPPSVYSSWYPIELREDCNLNGIDDADDITNNPWWDDWGFEGGLGANGRIDECEWSGCPADVNFDLFVNGDDFDLFAVWFGESDGNADFNYDGFVNGDDFDLFTTAYYGGC